MSEEGWKNTAEFVGPEDATLVRRLYASGAMFVANYLALHPFGLALGVEIETLPEDDKTPYPDQAEERVTELFMGRAKPNLLMYETADPEGIEFGDDLLKLGLAKLTDEDLRKLRERAARFQSDVADEIGERIERREAERADG